MTVHKLSCGWDADREHCTCGALVMANAYRFSNGNLIAFDQYGKQMPYYQDRNEGAELIKRDFPNIRITPGEMIR